MPSYSNMLVYFLRLRSDEQLLNFVWKSNMFEIAKIRKIIRRGKSSAFIAVSLISRFAGNNPKKLSERRPKPSECPAP
ncbi:uncharacterized protein LOC120449416 isoform X3 [Drosophila santomea]|uniref:uncharacterized protein LOC120449416 isoform X3 n=1 Tax=Drosophila santomea TaxID=129105 RepID=UPI0019537F3B|nr:uncharacterized protein LOC120449416 isoform X3 [Drosophila santomea]